MKQIYILLIGLLLAREPDLYGPEFDFLSKKTHQIVLADNVPEGVTDRFKPLLYSWRPGKMELRNMCEIWECSYVFNNNIDIRKRFLATGCKNFRNVPCMNDEEKGAVFSLEKTVYGSNFAASIKLGDRTYGIIGDLFENSIVFEVDVKVVEKK